MMMGGQQQRQQQQRRRQLRRCSCLAPCLLLMAAVPSYAFAPLQALPAKWEATSRPSGNGAAGGTPSSAVVNLQEERLDDRFWSMSFVHDLSPLKSRGSYSVTPVAAKRYRLLSEEAGEEGHVGEARATGAPSGGGEQDLPELDNLPPVLRGIVEERREFQMNLGRAMDVLRRDMASILVKKPGQQRSRVGDASLFKMILSRYVFASHTSFRFYLTVTDFSIYHPDIRLTDPSGVNLRGLGKYKSGFAFFQTFLGFWFSPKSSTIQFRMVYDECRSAIRISWNAVLVPKLQMFPALTRPVHVDGISYYLMDAPSGKIIEHRIEKLIMNNAGVEPPYGILSLLQQDGLRLVQPQGGVPAGGVAGSMT